jgi:LPXTG-motif cell wall-anchored protein
MKKKDLLVIGIAAGLATASAIFFFWKRKKNEEERPPKKAPQVPIENPGDQSEFTTSASESEIG